MTQTVYESSEETTAKTGGNLPVQSVGEISQALKTAVEERFSWVRVRGEISGFKCAASGHLYMTMKDTHALLDAVCWRGTANRLSIKPEDGMEIVATGRLTTYPGRSKYQIVIEYMELAGEGALLKLLEARRRKLAAEGLFDAGRKQTPPYLPTVIGVVTSPTGAVIRDILHRLADRFPCHVLIWPVLVQGDAAAAQVASAIEGFNTLAAGGLVPRPDVLIVARGGGSLEDLWAFNEEIVVRAAAESTIPLISAVGHETDITLIDFAADLRAPTPTAAAELAVPVRSELIAQVMEDGARLAGAANRAIFDRRLRLDGLARGLPNPRRVLDDANQRLDDWSERLSNGLRGGLDRRRARLAELAAGSPRPQREIAHASSRLDHASSGLAAAVRGPMRDAAARLGQSGALLESFSYQRILERGFALVADRNGKPATSAIGINPGMALDVVFHDGKVAAIVDGDGVRPRPIRSSRSLKDEDDQGSLL
jgi:exodeoxyribonuclease VII large subunit